MSLLYFVIRVRCRRKESYTRLTMFSASDHFINHDHIDDRVNRCSRSMLLMPCRTVLSNDTCLHFSNFRYAVFYSFYKSAFFCRSTSCLQYVMKRHKLYTQEIRVVYGPDLWQRHRTNLAGRVLYWQWDVFHWMCTSWLGRSLLWLSSEFIISYLWQK